MTARTRLMRFRPTSIASQSATVLTASIIIAHLVFAVAWSVFAPASRTPADERALARQVAMVVRMVEAAPPSERAAVAAAAASTGVSVAFQPAPPHLLSPSAGRTSIELPVTPVVRGQLGSRFDIIGGVLDEGAVRPDRPVLAVGMQEGWLVFGVPHRPRFRGPFGVLSLPIWIVLLVGIPLAMLSLWAARRVTLPLARLAQASETLSPDGELLPVPANAPLEIRRMAGSFNALVGRLQKFAADRTGMLAAISHDLRTPLTRLRLRVGEIGDERLRAKALRDIHAMEVMIASSLAYVDQQRPPGPPQPLDLAALLQTLCDEFIDSGFDVTYAGPLRCPAVGRPHALERAISNLLDNAVKFGGSASLSLEASGAALVIEVADDGPGVAEAEKENVVKPFYRTDPARGDARGGVGLGLAIAQAIAQSHGGRLELRDRLPHGLCARVTIPRSAPAVRVSLAA